MNGMDAVCGLQTDTKLTGKLHFGNFPGPSPKAHPASGETIVCQRSMAIGANLIII
jgi:hypothetical protein